MPTASSANPPSQRRTDVERGSVIVDLAPGAGAGRSQPGSVRSSRRSRLRERSPSAAPLRVRRSGFMTRHSTTQDSRFCVLLHTSTTLRRMSPKPKIPPELHELEAEVMENVWGRDGEVAVREVMEALNRRTKKPRAYTTYMTILGRLHAKGLVTRRREGKTDLYRPVYTREEYADLRAQAGVDSLVEQYGDAAFSHFARQMARLDPDRRRQLQRLARQK